MRSVYVLLVAVFLSTACHNAPQPALVQPSTNHLIPFSKDSLASPDGIRLLEIHLDGRRFLKYVYKNGYLDEEISYSTDQRALYLGSSHYVRDAQGLRKIEYRGRTYDEGYPSADSTVLRSVQTVSRPADTLINLSSPTILAMSFDKNGIVLRQSDSWVNSHYAVDGRFNVVFGTHISADNQKSTTNTAYQYDTHPNPYRTTGRLALSTRFSTFITDYSTTNVISYVSSSAAQAYTNTIRYEYEYRQDGYPKRVKVYDSQSEVYKPVLEFIYNK